MSLKHNEEYPFPSDSEEFNQGYLLRKKWDKNDYIVGVMVGIVITTIWFLVILE